MTLPEYNAPRGWNLGEHDYRFPFQDLRLLFVTGVVTSDLTLYHGKQSGKPWTKFRVRSFTGRLQDDGRRDIEHWYIMVFGKLAEKVVETLVPGCEVLVLGSLRQKRVKVGDRPMVDSWIVADSVFVRIGSVDQEVSVNLVGGRERWTRFSKKATEQ